MPAFLFAPKVAHQNYKIRPIFLILLTGYLDTAARIFRNKIRVGGDIMALPFKIGKLKLPKFSRLKFSRPQLGVRGSLFAAFAAIAGMAIVISAGAGMVLGQLGGMMQDLS